MNIDESIRRLRLSFINGSCLVIVLILTQIITIQGQYGQLAGQWKVEYENGEGIEELRMESKGSHVVNLTIYDVDLTSGVNFYFQIQTESTKLAVVDKKILRSELVPAETAANLFKWSGSVEVQTYYFGYTQLYVILIPEQGTTEYSKETQKLAIFRAERLDDKIFSYSAASLVLLMFVNLGTVLDLQRVKLLLLRPIAPFIGFCCRYILMPALGLGMGFLFFPHQKYLQLALFFTALSPSGGLANICNVFLKGNINLSIATTMINSLLALAMLPFWIFLLARVVYDDPSLGVPFLDLAIGSIALILSISLGVILRLLIPKTTRFIFRFLKPLSVFLSLCLVALTVGINLFSFKELTLMIALAAFCLPIVGYLLTFGLMKLLCRSSTDSLTIAIETSVLNMTVPIVLLQFSLGDPMADMMLIVPIMSALMSLVLVVIFYTVRRIFGWNKNSDLEAFSEKHFLISENQ